LLKLVDKQKPIKRQQKICFACLLAQRNDANDTKVFQLCKAQACVLLFT